MRICIDFVHKNRNLEDSGSAGPQMKSPGPKIPELQAALNWKSGEARTLRNPQCLRDETTGD